ncbi:hypothetical protein [Flavobacterium daemonense]|uniref:hypothetical protein n=1 Tax=Flavobacterium daemonense TaxID=1393049 RepID=UPI00118641E7|nr:hypothetical protein [Flavobacterium daemonense]KAF2337253.1 hypothetical protein FND99_02235 [Flavobacterium daemonense]
MKKIRFILFVLTFFVFGVTHAHKDRVSFPEKFTFILKNKETFQFKANDLKLNEFCQNVIDEKIEILKAEICFKTGEIVTVGSDGINWTMFKISFKGKNLYIAQNKLPKIPEIHFSTLKLLWSGESNAFGSHYLYLTFDIGTKHSFNVYPNLELYFENGKFSRSEVWIQTSENSRQGKIF